MQLEYLAYLVSGVVRRKTGVMGRMPILGSKCGVKVLLQLVGDTDDLVTMGYCKDYLRSPYSWMCNKGFPALHSRLQIFRNRSGLVMTNQFSGDDPIETCTDETH